MASKAAGEEKVPRPPDELVEKFRLRGVLGYGGMGAVFLGELPSTGKPCAVKLVRATANPRHKARLSREAKILSRIRHPNLVEVFDLGFVDDQPWIAMEYVQGQHLGKHLKAGRGQQAAWTEEIALGVSRALSALHEKGIIHRDIKPGNIMVDGFERPIVMDLGLALEEDASRLTQTGHVVGTLRYLAPEVFLGSPASPAADWYSLGVTLYKALEGRSPYSAEDVYAMVARRRWSSPPRMGGPLRNHPLATLTQGLLEADPRRRIQDLRTVLSILRRTPPRARPGPAGSPRKTRTMASHAVLAAARTPSPVPLRRTLACLVLSGLVGAWWTRARSPAPPPRPPAAAPTRAPAEPPVQDGRPPYGEGAAAWGRWAGAALEEAHAEHGSQRQRSLRRLHEALRAAPGEGPVPRRRVETCLALADRGEGRASARVWLDRAARSLDGVPDPRDQARLASRLADLRDRGEAPGAPAPPFPATEPPRSALYALRSFSVAEVPSGFLDELLTFGWGLGEGFDLVTWAGDLARHPLVVLARSRQARGHQQTLDPDLVEGLEEARRWEPPPGDQPARFKLWLELQVHAAVQLHQQGVDGAVRTRRRRQLARQVEDAGLPPGLREVSRGWLAMIESFWEPGLGERRSGPAEAAVPEVREAFRKLADGEWMADAPRLRTLLALEAAHLWARLQLVLLACDEAEAALVEARGRLDWEAFAELGAGAALVDMLSLSHDGEVTPEVEYCSGQQMTYRVGGRLGLIRFLDRPPAHLR